MYNTYSILLNYGEECGYCVHIPTLLFLIFFFVLRNLILTVNMTDFMTNVLMVEITCGMHHHDYDGLFDRSLDGCIETYNSI